MNAGDLIGPTSERTRWPIGLDRHFIDGQWLPAEPGPQLAVVDPSTEQVVAHIPAGSQRDVDLAVSSARRAVTAWASTPLEVRIEAIRRFADALEQQAGDLARLEQLEMGKPLRIAEDFIGNGIRAFRADIAVAKTYDFVEERQSNDGAHVRVERLPLGVVALIVPWNFTVTNILFALAPLLLSGNTVVVKPSEKAPLSAVRMFELLDMPAGVLNLLLGDGRAGAPLAAHPDVDLVHFTGSVDTGRAVGVAAAANFNRAVLELGGKDPLIVDAGVDPVWAARQAALACFVNTGQICTSAERIYVHADVANQFLSELVREADKYTNGGSGAERSGLGPLVDERQRQIVHRHVAEAVTGGAQVLAGGYLPQGPGYYYPATVVTGVSAEMDLLQEETFGPVAPVTVVDDFDEAIQLARDGKYGLAATILSDDPAHIARARELPAGIVWVNKWQGGGFDRTYEPAGVSGMGATGGRASFDAATRAMTIVNAPAGNVGPVAVEQPSQRDHVA